MVMTKPRVPGLSWPVPISVSTWPRPCNPFTVFLFCFVLDGVFESQLMGTAQNSRGTHGTMVKARASLPLSSCSTHVPPWRQPLLGGPSPDLPEPVCAFTHTSVPCIVAKRLHRTLFASFVHYALELPLLAT